MQPLPRVQPHSPTMPNAATPREGAKTDAEALDVYAFVPAAALRKGVKSNWESKFIAANRPRLAEDEILQWADAHFERTGR